MNSVTKRLVKDIPLKLLMVSGLFLLAVFLFAFIAHEVIFEKDSVFDNKAFQFFHSYTTPGLIQLAVIFSFFGSHLFFIPAYILLCTYFFLRKKKRLAIDILIIGITSTLLMFFLKDLFHRQRPDLPLIKTLHNYSFPSGHALCSFVFCSILVYITWLSKLSKGPKTALSIFFILFSIAIGLSRIVLRYHFASDVLAGFSLGFAWVLFSLWTLNKFSKRARPGRHVIQTA
jgi:undecaprenyl-diphosphatase